ncbi:MAG: hypothetical protein QMD92_07605 [bacterium]|nr:hypothetical protein [bacterium]
MSVLKPLTKISIADLWEEVKDEKTLWGDLKEEAQLVLKRLLEGCIEEEINQYLRARKYERKREQATVMDITNGI